jgi:mannose-1-phosphate guanylyltransferase
LPKQFLPLAGAEPLLAQTVRRLEGLVPAERTLIVTGESLAGETRRLLPQLPTENLLAEPRAASTAPALTWATVVAADRDPAATLLTLHADWWVGDDEAFRRTAARALDAAEARDALVTVGIVPTRPDGSYGYIEKGDPLEADLWAVRRFTEKPDPARAARLMAAGALWNSGLFAWTARRFLAETEAHAPEIAPRVSRLRAGDVAGFFQTVTPIAVDVSHFERSGRVVVVAGQFAWDDVGTWAALARVRRLDSAGNVVVGDALVREAADSVVWGDDGPVVVDGVRGLVVVRARGRVLVTTRERAGNLKTLLEALPERMRRDPTR